MDYTNEELERIAYISGDVNRAVMLAKCADFDEVEYGLDSDFTLDFTIQDQIDSRVAKEIEKACPNYAEYKAFFESCFERLNGHYPCPSVTSDYDQSVIFDAIDRGEA